MSADQPAEAKTGEAPSLKDLVRRRKHAEWYANEPGVNEDDDDETYRRVEVCNQLDDVILETRAVSMEDARAALELALSEARNVLPAQPLIPHLIAISLRVLDGEMDRPA